VRDANAIGLGDSVRAERGRWGGGAGTGSLKYLVARTTDEELRMCSIDEISELGLGQLTQDELDDAADAFNGFSMKQIRLRL
jgi:hypothetical protein